MITDSLINIALYKCLSKNFATAIDFFLKNDLNTLPLGKTLIDGDTVFVSINEYTCKDISLAKWESHKKYADIQLVLKGSEKMGFAPLDGMTVLEDYNIEKDLIFYNGSGDYVTVDQSKFVIFMPQDAHQPGVCIGQSEEVKKVVFKVLM